jgi:hypothetical protein
MGLAADRKIWIVEFAAMAGYDCMTDAWKITGPKGQRIYFDCAGFGQKSCDFESDAAKKAIGEAGDFADYVKDALNAYMKP